MFFFNSSLFHRKLVVFLLSVLSAASYYAYITPGEHQQYVQTIEQHILWWAWWVFTIFFFHNLSFDAPQTCSQMIHL